MVNVANQLNDRWRIRILASALGLDDAEISAVDTDKNSKVNEYAYAVLKAWRGKVGSNEEAYQILGRTLRENGFVQIAEKCLEFY